MRARRPSVVWEIFIPRLPIGSTYKYEILGPHGMQPLKADPVALQAPPAPLTASVVADPTPFAWIDQTWQRSRDDRHRKRVVQGKSVAVRVDISSRRHITHKNPKQKKQNRQTD